MLLHVTLHPIHERRSGETLPCGMKVLTQGVDQEVGRRTGATVMGTSADGGRELVCLVLLLCDNNLKHQTFVSRLQFAVTFNLHLQTTIYTLTMRFSAGFRQQILQCSYGFTHARTHTRTHTHTLAHTHARTDRQTRARTNTQTHNARRHTTGSEYVN